MNDVTKIREDLSYFFSKLNIAASPLDAMDEIKGKTNHSPQKSSI